MTHWSLHFICSAASFLPMTSTGELSEFLAIFSTPSRSSRGRRLPLGRQTARSQDSGGEDTGIAIKSEVRP